MGLAHLGSMAYQGQVDRNTMSLGLSLPCSGATHRGRLAGLAAVVSVGPLARL